MIDISALRGYFMNDTVFVTGHAAERFRQRGIRTPDIRSAAMTGEIIEDYPDDFPHPSCLIFGKSASGNILHVVTGSDGENLYIITVYHPSTDKFESDLKTRKES